jgi:hypothetical protein
MKIVKISPKKSLNKAFLKQRPLRSEIELFKSNLIRLLDKIDEIEREENQKNHIRDFLRDTYYKETNEINTKDTKDLVIHLGKTNKDKVGVIIEAKRPGNKNEMISEAKPNSKAFQELILYYLRERIEENNIDIKYLIASNVHEWYIFEASYFEKHFYKNKSFVKQYEEWRDGKKVTKDTNLFYNDIAKPFIDKIDEEIPCTYFDIREYEKILRNTDKADDKNLIALQKLLSPFFLLKVPFANDSNSLNEKFYKELLHIIGLEEVKEGTKSIIRRKEKDKQAGSLIENAINILVTEDALHKLKDKSIFGQTKDEQLFGVALELSLTWINRILFLKLLEGQLITYHKGNKDYRFLNSEMIHDFDELYKLFHQVLARNISERTASIKAKYAKVPYLNSSLFEISELEDATIKINSLDNAETIELIGNTILKEDKKKNNALPALEYLFKFLDAYDFASEGGEDNKTIINASVLGKVFEKINGYKDGAIFTPGFITMYMSRQSLRLAVIQKFNDYFKTKKIDEVKTFEELYNRIDKIDIKTANEIINSLRICDPAVGSGHFLVSVLNELIVIKSELGILIDSNGKRLRDYEIVVDNDELIISDDNGIFEYNYQNKESQRVQETIFNERQTIIENCLFGVDINPNSVKICRLRLWIELLKSSYYKAPDFTELETLPNIDINIKCGNSLISRYALDADLKKALQKSKWNITSYRLAVMTYRNAKSKDEKRAMEQLINEIKNNFETEIQLNDKRFKKLRDLKGELFTLANQGVLFDKSEKEKKDWNKKVSELTEAVKKQEELIDEIKSNVIYKNAFEWRFEFPEVLDDKGDFVGFDVVIGNPPYGVSIKDSYRTTVVESLGKVPDFEIYYFFINISKRILKPNGIKSYIIPNTILFNVFAKNYRENLFNDWQINEILDCTEFNVFEGSATVRCIITQFQNCKSNDFVSYRPTANISSFEELISRDLSKTTKEILVANNRNWALVFKLDSKTLNIVAKIRKDKKTLIEYFPDISQGLIAYDKYQGQDEKTIKNRIYHSLTKQTGWKKWLWGEDITPYSVVWNGKEYINYCDGIANPREPKYFKGERVLVREITNPKIYAGFSNEESYNDPAIINILNNPEGKISIKVLLSILNSKLATYYHFNSSPKATKGAFPKILVEDLKNFPLPTISPKDQKALIDYVDKIFKNKEENKDTSDIESKIDQMVYRLYDLTDEEIKIVEGEK